MKLHIISDLHAEHTPGWSISAPPEADATLVAGDVENGVGGPWLLNRWFNAPGHNVLAVPGNHDYYRENINGIERVWAKRDGIRFRQREVVNIGDTAFFLCTLWTDFGLQGRQEESLDYAKGKMSDYDLIRTGPKHRQRKLTPEKTFALHEDAVEWLDHAMSTSFMDKKVVVTHHAPHPNSVSPRFTGHPLNPAFVSDLSDLIYKHEPTLWVHGHVHSSHDYMVGKTRIVANPRGYPMDRTGMRFENPDWNPNLVIEI